MTHISRTLIRACGFALAALLVAGQVHAQESADAQFQRGMRYFTGEGVAKNHAQAAAWFRKAADRGHAGAQYHLGGLYYQGWGVPKDTGQAMFWIRKAADNNSPNAQFFLGSLYQSGMLSAEGIPKDYGQAMAWYRRAADQGYGPASGSLGIMYEIGQGVKKNKKLAEEWAARAADDYARAAAEGDADGVFGLASMFELGKGGVPQDDATAKELYAESAARGNEFAQTQLETYDERQMKPVVTAFQLTTNPDFNPNRRPDRRRNPEYFASGRIQNYSFYTVSKFSVLLTFYDCPTNALTEECLVIGEEEFRAHELFSREGELPIPPREARDFTRALGRMPKANGYLQYRYDVSITSRP